MHTTPFLELRGVSRHFTSRKGFWDPEPSVVRAVDGVDLSIRRGETLGLVGESGCGKSTVARLVTRLLKPTTGDILLEGRSILRRDSALSRAFPRKVQMIFQDPFSSLNPRKNVRHAIAEPLHVQREGTRAERRDRVDELLAQVGLSPEHAGRYPHEFSGGQRQRIAVARALALNPELVVCDEPVSALDVSIQAQVLNLLQDLQDSLGLTYLFISHDLSVVGHVSNRVAVMYLGRILELAPAQELFGNPLHPYTRALLASVPVPDPDAVPARGGIPGELVTTDSGCPFRPRCPEGAGCPEEIPSLREISPGHFAACYRA